MQQIRTPLIVDVHHDGLGFVRPFFLLNTSLPRKLIVVVGGDEDAVAPLQRHRVFVVGVDVAGLGKRLEIVIEEVDWRLARHQRHAPFGAGVTPIVL